MKSRLLKAQILEYKCATCGISEWNNNPITLQLDHINGVHDDHRLNNLRLLCPNCHSQTSTYAGKNVKRKIYTCIDCGCSIHSSSIRCSKCEGIRRSKTSNSNIPDKDTLLQLVMTKPFV